MYDRDFIGRDDLIGSTWIDLKDLLIGNLHEFKQRLEDSKSIQGGFNSGAGLGTVRFSIEACDKRDGRMTRKISESTDCSFDFDGRSGFISF